MRKMVSEGDAGSRSEKVAQAVLRPPLRTVGTARFQIAKKC